MTVFPADSNPTTTRLPRRSRALTNEAQDKRPRLRSLQDVALSKRAAEGSLVEVPLSCQEIELPTDEQPEESRPIPPAKPPKATKTRSKSMLRKKLSVEKESPTDVQDPIVTEQDIRPRVESAPSNKPPKLKRSSSNLFSSNLFSSHRGRSNTAEPSKVRPLTREVASCKERGREKSSSLDRIKTKLGKSRSGSLKKLNLKHNSGNSLHDSHDSIISSSFLKIEPVISSSFLKIEPVILPTKADEGEVYEENFDSAYSQFKLGESKPSDSPEPIYSEIMLLSKPPPATLPSDSSESIYSEIVLLSKPSPATLPSDSPESIYSEIMLLSKPSPATSLADSSQPVYSKVMILSKPSPATSPGIPTPASFPDVPLSPPPPLPPSPPLSPPAAKLGGTSRFIRSSSETLQTNKVQGEVERCKSYHPGVEYTELGDILNEITSNVGIGKRRPALRRKSRSMSVEINDQEPPETKSEVECGPFESSDRPSFVPPVQPINLPVEDTAVLDASYPFPEKLEEQKEDFPKQPLEHSPNDSKLHESSTSSVPDCISSEEESTAIVSRKIITSQTDASSPEFIIFNSGLNTNQSLFDDETSYASDTNESEELYVNAAAGGLYDLTKEDNSDEYCPSSDDQAVDEMIFPLDNSLVQGTQLRVFLSFLF